MDDFKHVCKTALIGLFIIIASGLAVVAMVLASLFVGDIVALLADSDALGAVSFLAMFMGMFISTIFFCTEVL